MSVTVSPDKKMQILIVDDDLFMRVTFRDALETAGFETFVAEDGETAIAAFQQLQPDLVLLDLMMPGKDGFATCRELRSMRGGEYTPVLMVTGLGDTESIRSAFEAGATDFIIKPVNPDLLVYRVCYMLRASLSTKKHAKSEARLANAQRIARLGNWEWDPVSGSMWGSEETVRLLGLENADAMSGIERFLAAVYGPDRENVQRGLLHACKNGTQCGFEFRVMLPDDSFRILCMQGEGAEPAPGKGPCLEGTIQDITKIRQVEERLVMLKEAVDSLPIGIAISDVSNRIVYTNPAEAQMHGYSMEALMNRDVRDLKGLNLDHTVISEKIGHSRVWRREGVNVRESGEEFPVQLSSIAVINGDEKCLGLVTVCEDITSRKKVEEKIRRLAFYDSLTGLPNRAAFLDRLQHALALAQREGRQAALLFLDLDNFKDINDAQGHDFGDRLIRAVAERLSACMREYDSLARLGGDEFVIVLTSLEEEECAASAAIRLLSTFARPFLMDCRQVYSSASIGIAMYPDDGLDADTLFKCADTAMYHAKTEGKANFRFFSPEMNRRVMRRVALESSLRQGMEKGEFFLHYQPQLDLKVGRMLGVEALLRWESPELGPLMPSEFIPFAEDSGQIIPLGEWAMRAACIQAREWALAGLGDLKMAVNISGLQFRQAGFMEMVGRIIEETGVKPAALELEFTESVVMEHADKTIETLKRLKDMGLSLSIDDFGTGYSSLSYLKNFPIDRIKIDRSFVADLDHSRDAAAIVEAIIFLAHSLNLKVVAEGVETSEQLQFLKTRNCDEVQGFHLAMPMSAEELVGNLWWPERVRIGGYPAAYS
jgi:diguanylate cyclase (GGDEF)-like protein/PAS domain S-box-containing protein